MAMQTLSVTVDLEKCDSHVRASEYSVSATDVPYSATSILPTLEVEQPDTDNTFPDGGLRAWLTVAGAFLAVFCTFGQLNSFGTFQSWYADHQLQHLPQSTISWIGSLQLWVFFFSGGFIGRLFDAYGPRVIMIPGTAILVLSIMVTSVSTQYYQYVLGQGVLFGLGVGMLFYPSLSAISTHFFKFRATALGVAVAGSGVGGVVYPIMLDRLFVKVGFGWAVRISGFIALAFCAVACATVTSRLPARTRSAPNLETKIIKDTPFLLVVIGSIFISLGLFIPFFYIVEFATSRGVSATMAFYVLSVMNAGGIFGRLAPSILSDSFGRFNLIVPCAFLTGLSALVIWIFADSLATIMVFAIVYGFFSGAFNALIIPCIGQISDIRAIGTRVGVLYSIISFPSLCGGPAAGALLKFSHGSYSGMIALSGSTVLVGSLFLLWARLHLDSHLRARV
ncbi:MFS general substrate transporter [Obba rivulosa]|uniref:MFS general substrate transporter n=1 Tax=Obba rivulosa TaxID=1052685 RepID=A0A8E2DP33_9APHY|nr:MFS general substrate transporter [Obba rivulosa]